MTNSINTITLNLSTMSSFNIQMDKWDPIYYLILISIYISITVVYFYDTSNVNKNIQNKGSNCNSNPLDPEDPKNPKKKKSGKSDKLKNHLSKYKIEYILGTIIITTVALTGYCYFYDISLDDIINLFTRKRPSNSPDSPETIVHSAVNTGGRINNSENITSTSANFTNTATERSDRWMDLPGYKELNLLDRINESDLANTINPDESSRGQYDFDVDDYLSNYQNSLETQMKNQFEKEYDLGFQEKASSTSGTERQEYDFFLDDFDVDAPMKEADNYILEYEEQLAAQMEDQFQKEYYMNYDKRMAEEMEEQLQQELSNKLKEELYYNYNSPTPSQPIDQDLLDELDKTLDYFSNLAGKESFSKFMEEGE